jgi:hypothetical protein
VLRSSKLASGWSVVSVLTLLRVTVLLIVRVISTVRKVLFSLVVVLKVLDLALLLVDAFVRNNARPQIVNKSS